MLVSNRVFKDNTEFWPSWRFFISRDSFKVPSQHGWEKIIKDLALNETMVLCVTTQCCVTYHNLVPCLPHSLVFNNLSGWVANLASVRLFLLVLSLICHIVAAIGILITMQSRLVARLCYVRQHYNIIVSPCWRKSEKYKNLVWI